MTPDELAAAGARLYGERWLSTLAKTLHTDVRLVRRWLSGAIPIPAGIDADIAALLAIAARAKERRQS